MRQAFDEFVTILAARKLTSVHNNSLLQPVSLAGVVTAITGFNLHKAAGPDGLNNDSYKDTQAILAPAMVIIGNELLQGRDPPPSFVEGFIILLRKKGDSVDAMDYRPISLLQTGYK